MKSWLVDVWHETHHDSWTNTYYVRAKDAAEATQIIEKYMNDNYVQSYRNTWKIESVVEFDPETPFKQLF